MPEILRPDGAVIHYQVDGSGEPLLALAPGCISSAADRWAVSRVGPLTPLEQRFSVITMDQRHAGRSRATLKAFSYDDMLGDQIAVLNAAGARSAHLLGAGLGAVYALKLAYDAPARVRSAALIEPRGAVDESAIGAHYAPFSETIRTARADGLDAVIEAAVANGCFAENPAAGPWAQRLHDEPAFRDALASLGRELYITLVVDFRDGVFPWGRRHFSVNDVAIERIRAPLAVLPGSDALHPAAIGTSIIETARNAQALDTALTGTDLLEAVSAFFDSTRTDR